MAALALVLALGALGACADDDGSDIGGPATTVGTAGAIPYDAWHDEVAAICADAHAEVVALEQGIGPDSTAEDLLAVVAGTEEVGARQVGDIEAVGAPAHRTDDAEALVAAMEAQLALFGPILDAGEAGGADALREALAAPEVAATQGHLDDVARSLDLPDCGTGDGS